LLQSSTFHTTVRASARLDTSTIDYAVLPPPESLYEAPSTDPFVHMRVPLTPDDFAVAGHGPDAPDAPLAAPEIVVLAAHPENVVPAALTEVEGMGIDGVELNFAHDEGPEEKEPGMLTDLWKGLMEDVFGEDEKKVS